MITFFTRIPVGVPDYTVHLFAKGMKTLPFVGLLIGICLYLVSFLGSFVPETIMSFLLVLIYCLITGTLFFDGVADTCDGIFSGADKEDMLEMMRENRIRTFGVLGVILLILCYFVFFQEVSQIALLLMPVMGKSAMVIASFRAKTAKKSGLGYGFISRIGSTEVIWALLVPVLLCAALEPICLFAMLVTFSVAFGIREGLERWLGGLTGDTITFVCEVSQAVFLISLFFINILADIIPTNVIG